MVTAQVAQVMPEIFSSACFFFPGSPAGFSSGSPPLPAPEPCCPDSPIAILPYAITDVGAGGKKEFAPRAVGISSFWPAWQ
jgi:hypothetical protein